MNRALVTPTIFLSDVNQRKGAFSILENADTSYRDVNPWPVIQIMNMNIVFLLDRPNHTAVKLKAFAR